MLNGTNAEKPGERRRWWARRGSNPRPIDYESTALTAELQALMRREVKRAARHPGEDAGPALYQ